jgi:hypothetical protein
MSSTTTNNAGTLENVAKHGRRGYIVEDRYLVDLEGLSRSEARAALEERVLAIIAELREYTLDDDDDDGECQHSVQFTVGKTGVTARKGMALDPMKKTTWVYAATNKPSVGHRWSNKYAKGGYLTVIPIACVTTRCIPEHMQYPRLDAQRYALDLEEDLYVVFQAKAKQNAQELGVTLLQGNSDHYTGKKGKNTVNALLYVALKHAPRSAIPSTAEAAAAEEAEAVDADGTQQRRRTLIALSGQDVIGGDGAGLIGHEQVAQRRRAQRSRAQPVDLAAVVDALLQPVRLGLTRGLFLCCLLLVRRLLLVVGIASRSLALLASCLLQLGKHLAYVPVVRVRVHVCVCVCKLVSYPCSRRR